MPIPIPLPRTRGGKAAAAGVAVGGVMLVTASLTGALDRYEGERLKPYRDIVGVWTVCRGVTGPHVIPGKNYTTRSARRSRPARSRSAARR